MSTDLTMEEFTESLTGFEEIAIAKHFGEDISTLPENKPTMFMRALVFTDLVRNGGKPTEAKDGALGLSMRAVTDYFATDRESVPDDPETESGKDDSRPDSPPSVSLASA